MELFNPVFNQMIGLFIFLIIGFILARCSVLDKTAATTLSRLENYVFVPALILNTFIYNCNADTIRSVWKLVVMSLAIAAAVIPLSFWIAKLLYKERYLKSIATYALSFSNFGFLGNAIMQAVFPEIFFEYTMFVLPFWVLIYAWGAPVLLIAGSTNEKKVTFGGLAKSFVNPLFISVLVGILLGLTGWGMKFSSGIKSTLSSAAACMSPVAMLLTGIVVGKCNVSHLLKKWRLYAVTAVKLVAYPLAFLLIFALVPQNSFVTVTFLKCAVCFAAAPMGLNTIVIPAAYGKDTTDAAGMALISHFFAVATIPLMYMLLDVMVL